MSVGAAGAWRPGGGKGARPASDCEEGGLMRMELTANYSPRDGNEDGKATSEVQRQIMRKRTGKAIVEYDDDIFTASAFDAGLIGHDGRRHDGQYDFHGVPRRTGTWRHLPSRLRSSPSGAGT